MHLILFLAILAVFPRIVESLDNIVMPYDRFQYDLEQFIPVVTQEVEFAELPGITDDQAYEQLKTFFPTLQLRIQELRNMGVLADEKRRTLKEAIDKMCGQGHVYSYLKVNRRLKDILELLHTSNVNTKNNLSLLTAMRNALQDWRAESKMPCKKRKSV